MDIHVDSLPMAGKAFRFSVREGVGNTLIEVYVDSKLIHAHDCDDPPCHEMAMVPPRTRGATLRVVATDTDANTETLSLISKES